MRFSQNDPPIRDRRSAPFPTHFLITFIESGASKVSCSANPFIMMKSLTEQLGGKPKEIQRQGKKYLAYVTEREQSNAIQKITHINKFKVTVETHPSFNDTKRIIYTSRYTPTTDFSAFAGGLAEDYGVTEVRQATWIKSRNANSIAYQITFPGHDAPEFIVIPGEQGRTKTYPVATWPPMCKKCLEYGHVIAYCQPHTPQRCKKCAGEHDREDCTVRQPKCYHCSCMHEAGDRDCHGPKKNNNHTKRTQSYTETSHPNLERR